MNINELYELLQNIIDPEELDGDFTLTENAIVWSYSLTEEIDDELVDYDDEENEDFFTSFETINRYDELYNIYLEDLHTIKLCLSEYNEEDNWNYTEPDVKENSISFKII